MANEELLGRLIQKLLPFRKAIYLLFIPLVVIIFIFSLPLLKPNVEQPNLDPVALPSEFSACRENPLLKHRPNLAKKFNQPADYDLTILIAGRNDFYGGKPSVLKLQHGLDILNGQISNYTPGLKVELILIDWNPNPDMRPLLEEIKYPPNIASFRVISVPASFHKCWTSKTKMPPVAEFLSKNIGIRRARGKYILPKAMDTIYSQSFWDFIARGDHIVLEDLSGDPLLFRMMRIDISITLLDLPVKDRLEEILEKSLYHEQTVRYGASNQVIRNNQIEKYQAEIEYLKSNDQNIPWTQGSGDFLLMSRENWWKIRGFVEVPTYMHWDTVILAHARATGLRYYNLVPPFILYHPTHSRAKSQSSWNQTNWMWYFRHPSTLNPNDKYWGHPFHDFDEVEWKYGVRQTTANSKS